MPVVSERLVALSTTPLPTEASVVGKASVTATPAPTVVPVAGPVVTAWPSPALWASVFPLAESETAPAVTWRPAGMVAFWSTSAMSMPIAAATWTGVPPLLPLLELCRLGVGFPPEVSPRLPRLEVPWLSAQPRWSLASSVAGRTASAEAGAPRVAGEPTLVPDVCVGVARPAGTGATRSPRAVVFALGPARRGLGQGIGVRGGDDIKGERSGRAQVALDRGQRLVHRDRQRQRDSDRGVGRARRTSGPGVGGGALGHVLAQPTSTKRHHCSTHDVGLAGDERDRNRDDRGDGVTAGARGLGSVLGVGRHGVPAVRDQAQPTRTGEHDVALDQRQGVVDHDVERYRKTKPKALGRGAVLARQRLRHRVARGTRAECGGSGQRDLGAAADGSFAAREHQLEGEGAGDRALSAH